MKRLITFAFMTICMVVSCSKFDDSAIWDKLNDHESRIAYLEEVCKKMNSDIINLQTIVTALESNDYIVNASPLATGDGYTFTFKSGKSVVIYEGKNGVDGTDGKDGADGKDGKDGVDGKNGVTPTIGVMKDVDGVYYWTVNNEWLLVNGEKVKAAASDGKNGEDGKDGQDGVTPKFKIEADYWYISYDNGASWEMLGKATGEDGKNGSNGIDGDSIFSQVSQDEEYVYFYLANGTMITLPKHNADIIQFEDLAVKAICCKNWDTNEDGELSYTEAESVMTIGTAFKGNTSIIAFNEFKYFVGVSDLPESAFSGCKNLWKITLPNTLKSINSSAFSSCESLANIHFPDGLVTIGSGAFSSCSRLKSISVPNSVIDLGSSAFSSCKGLLRVELGDNVINIGSSAFSGCTSLESIKIGKSVTTFGSSVFSSCTGKLTICCNLPNSTSSDGSIFKYSKFSEIVIDDDVLQIGDYAFYQLTSFTKVSIGAGVRTIGKYAFAECTGIKDLTIGSSVYSIGERAFYNCSAITSLTLSDSIKSISTYAFYNCSSLTQITIPDSVSSIGSYAFASCYNLTKVTIGTGITSIGSYAFYSNSKLVSVYCKAKTPPTLNSTAFNNNATNRKFYVPSESLARYTAADNWKTFASSIVGYTF